MKTIFPLLRISAKQSFKILRSSAPLKCSTLNNDIYITKIFFDHIAFSKKSRSQKDIIERLLIIPFIQDILEKGEIIETRNSENKIHIKFSLSIQKHIFSSIIVYDKIKDQHYLLSCFKEFENHTLKKDLS